MNVSPLEVLGPVFHFLDEVIANYGVYLYLVFVWLCLILIAWILVAACGGNTGREILPWSCRHYITPGPLVESHRHYQSSALVFDSESDDGNEHYFM